MKELQQKPSDKIEIVKQQQKKQTLILQKKIVPEKNHTIFEYNQISRKLTVAEYEPHRKDIHWHEAVEMFTKKKQKKIDINKPETITKAKIINKPNCLYVSALNIENAIKVFKRDYEIIITTP